MDSRIASEDEIRIYNEIQEKQAVLDKGWNRPKKPRRFIGNRTVSEDEYEAYQREQAERIRSLHSEDRFTSTGEEWEIDSDGLEYIPEWLNK